MKISEMLNVYSNLSTAKLTKLSDEEKIDFIKFIRKIKPCITEFEEARKDALESAKSENHDELVQKLLRWQREGDNVDLTDEEKIEINNYITSYENIVNKSLEDILNKDINNPISESLFNNLIISNDWSVDQIMLLESNLNIN